MIKLQKLVKNITKCYNFGKERGIPQTMKYYKITEAAKLLNVTPETLRNWERKGKFVSHHRTEGGQRLYSEEQIEEIIGEKTKVVFKFYNNTVKIPNIEDITTSQLCKIADYIAKEVQNRSDCESEQ